MHVMVVHHTPSLTKERYEAVVRGLTRGKARLEAIFDVPTGGLLVDVAAETDAGFMIFDVFESQAAFDSFREVASPSRRTPARGAAEELPGAHVQSRASTERCPGARSSASAPALSAAARARA